MTRYGIVDSARLPRTRRGSLADRIVEALQSFERPVMAREIERAVAAWDGKYHLPHVKRRQVADFLSRARKRGALC